MIVLIQADHAPHGRGFVTYVDGALDGDPEVLVEAKKITIVQRSPDHGREPMDWSDGYLAAQALQEAMCLVHGGPLYVKIEDD